MPGDPIVYLLRFECKANVRSVSAVFVAEESGAEVLLEGEVEKKERAREDGARLQTALLKQPGDPPEEPKKAGTYHLRRLEVHTHAGRTLDFDNPPEGGFRWVEEPAELPVRREAAWVLPEWHPDGPPGRR